jgi:hypothetical protein
VSIRAQVLLWAQRTIAKGRDAHPHQLLDIPADATLEAAQAAFHAIARKAHPDLHRTALTPDELEQITAAFSRITAAYEDFRRRTTSQERSLPRDGTAPISAEGRAARSRSPTGAPPTKAPPTQMSSKALVYYRKAELALRRGDLTSGLLQLKMAIAADPQSAFLRAALAEVQAEVSKKAEDPP